jgi:hypothetical protein
MSIIAHARPVARRAPLFMILLVLVAATATSEIVRAQDASTADTGTFSAGAPLDLARVSHRATLLDDGRILISGGFGETPTTSSTAEVYDAGSGVSGPASPLAASRTYHSANLLSDGRVVLLGGTDSETAEIWDPASGTSHLAGSLTDYRANHTATTLADGSVLITGGYDGTGLPDGRVLLIGGGAGEAWGEGQGVAVAVAEIWDPVSMTFAPAGSLIEPRMWHTATLLPDGRVLVAGGVPAGEPGAPLATAELWDPVSMTFSPAASLAVARGGHSATLMPDGRVVIAGGSGPDEVPLDSTEIWDPGT